MEFVLKVLKVRFGWQAGEVRGGGCRTCTIVEVGGDDGTEGVGGELLMRRSVGGLDCWDWIPASIL